METEKEEIIKLSLFADGMTYVENLKELTKKRKKKETSWNLQAIIARLRIQG